MLAKNGTRMDNPEAALVFTTSGDPEKGKAIPYGVYDVTNNQGWVSVGIDHDTAYFAARTIGRWWRAWAASASHEPTNCSSPQTAAWQQQLPITVVEGSLQELADQIDMLKLRVCHFPPGTSKWNKIEHRLFSYITKNWRGKPLLSEQVIVDLIASTTLTTTGLIVRAALHRSLRNRHQSE